MIDDAMCVSRRHVCLAMINDEATRYKTRIVMRHSHHEVHSANCEFFFEFQRPTLTNCLLVPRLLIPESYASLTIGF